MEPGDFAVRGGIIDIFPPGDLGPVRLDLFGDILDGARRFDPATQLTTEKLSEIEFLRFILRADIFLDQLPSEQLLQFHYYPKKNYLFLMLV